MNPGLTADRTHAWHVASEQSAAARGAKPQTPSSQAECQQDGRGVLRGRNLAGRGVKSLCELTELSVHGNSRSRPSFVRYS